MESNRAPKNYLWLSPVLVLLVIGLCVGLQFVPDRYWPRGKDGKPLMVLGQPLKRPDMMSMFHEAEDAVADEAEPDTADDYLASMPSAAAGVAGEVESGVPADSAIGNRVVDSVYRAMGVDLSRDSVGTAYSSAEADTSFHSIPIEDFTPNHAALARFYAKLEMMRDGTLGRGVHIAFLGDSFIEGDILVADLRSGLQKEYGGGGVGFVPVATEVDQYRSTVRMKNSGWKAYSILYNRQQKYALSGMTFEAAVQNPTIEVASTKYYPNILRNTTVSVISEGKSQYDVTFVTKDTVIATQVTLDGEVHMSRTPVAVDSTGGNFTLKFGNAQGMKVLGLTIERPGGICVDNYSLRGNSGTILQSLSTDECVALNSVRPYDLIILQYGLNVASDSTKAYGWYSVQMQKALARLKQCFPTADFLILGVSDRAHNTGAGLQTMPAVLSLMSAQRDCAKKSGVAFWNTYEAMGGRNSMVKWVKWNWAAQDYTHIGFKGGRRLAGKLLEALDFERKHFYSGHSANAGGDRNPEGGAK